MTPSQCDIEQAVKVLLEGGVVAHATDTCYGFACDVFNERALVKLYALKEMSEYKPVSILVSSLAEAEGYADFDDESRVLAQQYWPGALTLVLPRKYTLPTFLNKQYKSVGIRVPDHELSLRLTQLLGRPITTTSANVTMLPSPYTAKAIREQFKDRKIKPDFILDSGILSSENLPSTIIDMTLRQPQIIRQGSLVIPGICG